MADHRVPATPRSDLVDRPIRVAGVVLGAGLGGFVDGILLHQILQLHAMLSARLPLDTMSNMRRNMTADGLFHAGVWIATLLGVGLLWRALNRPRATPASGRAFCGALLVGWGLFNLVEGIVNHHLLGLHHVVERLGPSHWDWLFLLASVGLVVGGGWLARPSALRGAASAAGGRL